MQMTHEPADRKQLSRVQPPKATRWPRTERRQARIEAVLARRQPDLTVVLENVHDPHNVSAILRTCDAVGVMSVHVVYSVEDPPDTAFARQTSAGAAKWVEVKRHDTIDACFSELRGGGFAVLATALAEGARPLHAWKLDQPVALVLGNEMRGVSEEVLALADGLIEIPMMGMVQSLNVSVAAAVCLYEALRQRQAAGAYKEPRLSDDVLRTLTSEWLRR